jgi:hypothetical protein
MFFASTCFSKAYAELSLTSFPNMICQDKKEYSLTITGPANTFSVGADYSLGIWKPGTDSDDLPKVIYTESKKPAGDNAYTSDNITIVGERATIGPWHYKLWLGKGYGVLRNEPNRIIDSGSYTLYPKETCEIGLPVLEMSPIVQIGTNAPIKVRNINPDSDYVLWFINGQKFVDGKFDPRTIIDETIKDSSGNDKNIKTASFSIQLDNNPGKKTLCLKHGKTTLGFGKDNCEIPLQIEVTTQPLQITPTPIRSGDPGDVPNNTPLFVDPTNAPSVPPPCAKMEKGKCVEVKTAIGNISTEPQAFVKTVFSIVLGLAGGIALILIVLSGYRWMLSRGNPEAVKAATEQFTSAIIGLVFIILSFVILQIIGVDILQIPGFTK